VAVALAAAILTLILVNRRRLPALRASMDANASVLPAFSVASLVGFGAVVPRCRPLRWWATGCCRSRGGPLVSLAVATNVLAAITGSASGGLTDRARRAWRHLHAKSRPRRVSIPR